MDPQKPKLKLSDVLGALVSSIASARNVADVEALRIADRYRQNEMLRGLPVPRLRFSRIAVTLPIMITGVVPAVQAEAAVPGSVAEATTKALGAALDALAPVDQLAAKSASAGSSALQGLDDEETRATADASKRLLDAVSLVQGFLATYQADLGRELADELLDLHQRSGGVAISDSLFREAARETSTKVLRRLLRRTLMQAQLLDPTAGRSFDPEDARQRAEAVLAIKPTTTLLQQVAEAAQRAAVVRPTALPDLDVLVDTDTIKNAGGGPATVTQLHLTLLEEGLEWVGEEQRDGSRVWKLTQE
ncbi:hypothetical protein [Chondromyces crocatus]|uniref:Uncharacterized protein n=1 Tax=Chondromyces crocatus TaxID=52 RepID=A0A0K1ESI3_CHOCO|nr:hypothetical protein [Chondromyces crocatus]AKT43563.1 uncharacterized protein CMC5_077950 [Chondromyces crocatus]